MRRAVVELMGNFAKEIYVISIADGVETTKQMEYIKSLCIH